MKLSKNKTPLTAVSDLSDEEIVWLHACGIRTWEEYCAYAQTYNGVKFAGSELFQGMVGADVYESIVNEQVAPHWFGCIIPEENLQQMMASCCETYEKKGVKELVFRNFNDSDDHLPHSVRLMDRMPAIRDQQERGTCTAFASVALAEFAEGCSTMLSPQFLYWASKKRDGQPNSDGTTLDTVQEALLEDGVCEESFWPYNGNIKYKQNGELDAGQGPAPADAVKNARKHLIACRALAPKAVGEYRRILAEGYPIVVGVATFPSWTNNRMTAETGRVPMPYMRQDRDGRWQYVEKPSGGHAMCLVGYVDDDTVPGGGYFIVRNSWGENWASECEEGAGHALMPYLYISSFTHAAFTLLTQSCDENGRVRAGTEDSSVVAGSGKGGRSPAIDALPPNLRPFARVLEHEERDFLGALLPVGTCVLSLPQPGSPFVEYKERDAIGNKSVFDKILEYSRFPGKNYWTTGQLATYDEILARSQEFSAKINANLSENSLKFKPFPEYKFSWHLSQLMGSQRTWSSKIVADFTDSLFKELVDEAVPAGEPKASELSKEWLDLMRSTISAKIRKVRSFSILPNTVYVVEVFATPFAYDGATGICQFATPTSRLVDMVKKCAGKAWKDLGRAKFVFYTIGTGLPLPEGLGGESAGEHSLTVSGPASGGFWEVRRPSYLTGQAAYRDFCDRLMPVTKEEIVSSVKTFVDEIVKNSGSMGSGKVTVGEIIEYLHSSKDERIHTSGKDRDLGAKDGKTQGKSEEKYCFFPRFRQTAIVRVLLQMHDHDPEKYVICREKEGQKEVFVIPSNEFQKGLDKTYRDRSWIGKLLLYHSVHFIGLMVCSAIFIGKAWIETEMGWNQSFIPRIVLAAATMCVCGLVQNLFNRFGSSSSEVDDDAVNA